MENKNIKNKDKNNKNIKKNEELSVIGNDSNGLTPQAAHEQAPGHLDDSSRSTDIVAQSLSDNSSEKIVSLHSTSKNTENVIRRMDGTVQPSGVDALIETVERLVGMDAEERRRVFAERRERMLGEKIDCAKFLTWFIEEYPDTVEEVRGAEKNFWERFR